jgi:hypothetical protein
MSLKDKETERPVKDWKNQNIERLSIYFHLYSSFSIQNEVCAKFNFCRKMVGSVHEIPRLWYGSKCVNAVIQCYRVPSLNKPSSLLINDQWKIEANEWENFLIQ